MSDFHWLTFEEILAFHQDLIQKCGGIAAILDISGLESASQRPKQLHHYANIDDPIHLAVAYAYGIIKNHPFLDGNKRTGLAAMGTFLNLCGIDCDFDKALLYQRVIALAAGQISEEEYKSFVVQQIASG